MWFSPASSTAVSRGPPYGRHLKQRFRMRSLRSILDMKWQARIANLKVSAKAEIISIEAIIHKSQYRWAGHAIPMDDQRLPKQLLCKDLSSGKRNMGISRKHFMGCVKTHLVHADISAKKLESEASDRPHLRSLIRQAQTDFEEQR